MEQEQSTEIELKEILRERYTDSPDLQLGHDTLMALCFELLNENKQLRSLNGALQSKIQALQQADNRKRYPNYPSLEIAEVIGGIGAPY